MSKRNLMKFYLSLCCRKFYGPHISGDSLDIDGAHNHIVTGSWRKENTIQVRFYYDVVCRILNMRFLRTKKSVHTPARRFFKLRNANYDRYVDQCKAVAKEAANMTFLRNFDFVFVLEMGHVLQLSHRIKISLVGLHSFLKYSQLMDKF